MGDVIFVDGTETKTNPYPCTPSVIASYNGVYVNKSVRYESYLAEVFIRCAEGREFFIQGSNRSMLVSMTGFTFIDSTIRVVDSSISVVNCTFTEAKQKHVFDVRYYLKSQRNVFFENCSFVRNFAPVMYVFAASSLVNFTLTRSKIINNLLSFNKTMIELQIRSHSEVAVQLGKVSARGNSFNTFLLCDNSFCSKKESSHTDSYRMMGLWSDVQAIRKKSSSKMKMDESNTNLTRSAVKGSLGSFSLQQSEFVNNTASNLFWFSLSEFSSKIFWTHFINNRISTESEGPNRALFYGVQGHLNILISSCRFVAPGIIVPGASGTMNVMITNSTAAQNHSDSVLVVLAVGFRNIWFDGLTLMNGNGTQILLLFSTFDLVVSNSDFSYNQQLLFYIYLVGSSRVSFLNSSFVGNTCANDSYFPLSEMIEIILSESIELHFFMENVTVLQNRCAGSLLSITEEFQQKVLDGYRYYTNANLPLGEERFIENQVITAFNKLNVIDNISGLDGVFLITFGNVLIYDSFFRNKFGFFDSSVLNFQGQPVFVELFNMPTSYKLKIKFIHRDVDLQAIDSFSFANTGSLKISGSVMKREEFGNVDAFLLIKSAQSVEIENSTLMCPIGTKLEFRNLSFWVETPYSNNSTRYLTYMFQCNACPTQTYSLKRRHSDGFTLNNDMLCRPCPPGGNGSHNIAAKPKYRGSYLLDQDEVEFKYCPMGYCCPSLNYSCPFVNEQNASHTGCQGNREETLCGKCIDGHSQTLFSGQCRHSSECRDYWFWPLSISIALLFIIYLSWKSSILRCFKAQVLWFLSYDSIVLRNSARNSGYLKIVFYFYQV